jgi:hypothetical protein
VVLPVTLYLLTYYAAGQALLVAAYLGHVLRDKPWKNTWSIRGMNVWAPLWLPLYPILVPLLVVYVAARKLRWLWRTK